MAKFYKVLAKGQRSCYGENHVWKVEKWYEVQGELIPCQNGFHFCRPENLLDWICEEIWEAEYEGEVIDSGNKLVARKARITRQCVKWNERTARLFACDCAQDVAHLIPGLEVQRCIEVARAYAFRAASYEELITAQEAAWEATWEVACDDSGAAARNAIWSIAREPAWAAARDTALAAAHAIACAIAKAEASTAAWVAARDAAWTAARKKQTKRLINLLSPKSEEVKK